MWNTIQYDVMNLRYIIIFIFFQFLSFSFNFFHFFFLFSHSPLMVDQAGSDGSDGSYTDALPGSFLC